MAIVHDVAESLCGDITPVENSGVTKKEKQHREREAMECLCRALGGPGSARARLVSRLWEEYEAGVTPEAQLVKDIDKLMDWINEGTDESGHGGVRGSPRAEQRGAGRV